MNRVGADSANRGFPSIDFGRRIRFSGSPLFPILNGSRSKLVEDHAMSTGFPFFMSGAAEERLRSKWGWFLVLGILLILAGAVAISRPAISTLTVVELIGYLLLFGGGVEIASGIWAGSWGGFFLHLLCGLLYLFLGAFVIERPLENALIYTYILAIFFVASGLVRMVMSLAHRFHGWGWMFFSGLITFALGIMIWRQWPEAALWVIGTFVGIDLIFVGWSWVMLGAAMKSLPATTAAR
jgi:uncharacterized membrane protein HdeD (DUF308 family)